MKRLLIPLFLGFAFIVSAIGFHRRQQALQRDDVRQIAELSAQLDSVRAAAVRAPAGPDSARLAESVAQRTYLLGRREYHIPFRQQTIDGWWTVTGPGTVLTLIGVLLIAVAVVVWYRARPRQSVP